MIGSAAERPAKAPFFLPYGCVIDARKSQPHQAMLVEFPVFVAVAAEPLAAIIMPLVGKPDRNPILPAAPDFLGQTIVELALPLAHEKGLDGFPPLQELGAVAPPAIQRVGKRNALGVTSIPGIFGHAHFLRGRLERERR